MRLQLLVPALCFLGAAFSFAGEDEFRNALKAYEHVWKAETPAEEKLRLVDDLLKEWEKLDDERRGSWENRFETVHFRKAEILASMGKFKESAQELVTESKENPRGQLEYSTRNPDAFFHRLVELQACLTAETGADPLANAVDYVFEKEGDGFMAARFELYPEVHQIEVPMVEGEKLLKVHHLRREDGKFQITSTDWLVVPEGKIREVMKKPLREVTFDDNGKMEVQKVKGKAGGK